MPGYISEVDYDGGANDNFVEVVVPTGTDVSSYTLVVYNKDGTIDATLTFDPPVLTIAGQDVYLFDSTNPNFPDIKNDEALALVDDTGTVLQFISFKDPVTATEGPANGQSATQVGEHSGGQESLVTSNGGGSYQTTSTASPGTISCFAKGTLIQTPDGSRPVQDLRVGDLVSTLNNGVQPIIWLRHARQPLLQAERAQKPVLIKANALGPDRPRTDVVVSPQHRILLGEEQQLQEVFEPTLAASKALVELSGVRHMRGKKEVEWFHFAFRRHEIVFANGCAMESLLLGPMVLKGLHRRERLDVMTKFGATRMESSLNGPLARPILNVWDAVAAIRRFKALNSPKMKAA